MADIEEFDVDIAMHYDKSTGEVILFFKPEKPMCGKDFLEMVKEWVKDNEPHHEILFTHLSHDPEAGTLLN
jgi:hypothetical protein